MNTQAIIALLLAPLLALVFFLYIKFKFNLATSKYLYQAFLFGMVSVLVIVILDQIAAYFGYDQLKNLKRSAFYSVVVVGFGSELGKFIFLRYVFLPLKSFRSPFESVIYSVLISMGFSTIALPLYANSVFSHGVDPLFLYTFPFANIIFSIIVGFFVGMGKLRKNRLIDSATGLGSATFFHAFYYFTFLSSDKTILLFYGIGVFFIAALLAVKAINVKDSDEVKSLNQQ